MGMCPAGYEQGGGEDRLCLRAHPRAGLRDPGLLAERRWVRGRPPLRCPPQGQQHRGALSAAPAPLFSPFPVLTTIEGIIDRAVMGLEQDQPARWVRCCGTGISSGIWYTLTLLPCLLALHPSNLQCYGLWFVLLTALSSAPGCPQHRSQTCLPFRRQQTKRWQVKSMSSSVN